MSWIGEVGDLPPIDLNELDDGQLRTLRDFLIIACTGESAEAVTIMWERVNTDRTLREWVWQRASEVDDELQRQVAILDAADLALHGGHRPFIDHDPLSGPGREWWLYCDCMDDGLGCYPDEQSAERGLEEHLAAVRGLEPE